MNAITINFTTRATYLAFKAEWSAQYAQTVADIRAQKLAIKANSRANHMSYGPYSALRKLRQDIIDLADIKAKAKIEANRQYLKEHAAPIAEAA